MSDAHYCNHKGWFPFVRKIPDNWRFHCFPTILDFADISRDHQTSVPDSPLSELVCSSLTSFITCTLLEVGLVLRKVASHLKCSYFGSNRMSSLPEPLFPTACFRDIPRKSCLNAVIFLLRVRVSL